MRKTQKQKQKNQSQQQTIIVNIGKGGGGKARARKQAPSLATLQNQLENQYAFKLAEQSTAERVRTEQLADFERKNRTPDIVPTKIIRDVEVGIKQDTSDTIKSVVDIGKELATTAISIGLLYAGVRGGIGSRAVASLEKSVGTQAGARAAVSSGIRLGGEAGVVNLIPARAPYISKMQRELIDTRSKLKIVPPKPIIPVAPPINITNQPFISKMQRELIEKKGKLNPVPKIYTNPNTPSNPGSVRSDILKGDTALEIEERFRLGLLGLDPNQSAMFRKRNARSRVSSGVYSGGSAPSLVLASPGSTPRSIGDPALAKGVDFVGRGLASATLPPSRIPEVTKRLERLVGETREASRRLRAPF